MKVVTLKGLFVDLLNKFVVLKIPTKILDKDKLRIRSQKTFFEQLNLENPLEIKDFANNNITQRYVVVRSAFNGEDLEGYYLAGLYDSRLALFSDLTLHNINKIILINGDIAVSSRHCLCKTITLFLGHKKLS